MRYAVRYQRTHDTVHSRLRSSRVLRCSRRPARARPLPACACVLTACARPRPPLALCLLPARHALARACACTLVHDTPFTRYAPAKPRAAEPRTRGFRRAARSQRIRRTAHPFLAPTLRLVRASTTPSAAVDAPATPQISSAPAASPQLALPLPRALRATRPPHACIARRAKNEWLAFCTLSTCARPAYWYAALSPCAPTTTYVPCSS
jgi:hypothetical protein